jgi:hypothetical protein
MVIGTNGDAPARAHRLADATELSAPQAGSAKDCFSPS